MPTYLCKLGHQDGSCYEQLHLARSRQQLIQELEADGFFVLDVHRQFGFAAFLKNHHGRLSKAGFLLFNQELLVLLKSGLPLLKALDTHLEQLEDGRFKQVLSDVRNEVKGGSALSAAFARHPEAFSPFYVAAIKAGERTGDLPDTLSGFLAYQKRLEAIRAKVRNASFYPLLLTGAALVVVTFLMFYVVPRFSQIYADANVDLPFMTQILISFARALGHYWYLFVIGGGVAYFLIAMALRSSSGRLLFDRLVLRLPFWGGLKINYAICSFTRTLATALNSGTPLVEAMRMSYGTLGNQALEQGMLTAITGVEEGRSLAEVFSLTGYFPALALRMVAVGETSGSMTTMLSDIGDYYEADVEQRLHRLTTMIEPLLMVVMGGLIAFIIVAMYVPIFQLAGTVG